MARKRRKKTRVRKTKWKMEDDKAIMVIEKRKGENDSKE